MFFFFLFCMVLSGGFIMISNLMSFFFFKFKEKSVCFECGYDMLSDTRISFSIQFFLFTLIFLLFDVEVSFLMPLPVFDIYFYYTYLGVMIFLLVLFFGLYYEWIKGVFDWLG